MGYSITIGELEVIKNPDDGLDCDCISFDAKGVHHDEAPAFGEPTDHTNSRWPSYSAWADTLRDSGLYETFFDSYGHLIGGHPGVRLVTSELVERVGQALTVFRIQNPDAKPEFGKDEADATLCRIIWLDYWLKWALQNCETPVIANH